MKNALISDEIIDDMVNDAYVDPDDEDVEDAGISEDVRAERQAYRDGLVHMRKLYEKAFRSLIEKMRDEIYRSDVLKLPHD